MAGGGAKGAYEAGAIHTLVHTLNESEAWYDVVSGVSVGSINAAAMGLFGPGESAEMGDYLLNLWKNMTTDQVYTFWPGPDPITEGLLNKGGLMDNSPLHDLLITHMQNKGNEFKKNVLVSANDANSGKYQVFKLNNYTDRDLQADLVVGSASVAFVFAPQNLSKYGMNYTLVDSGFTWNSNMDSGIDECFKIEGINDPSQIEVDVIMLIPDNLSPLNATYDDSDNEQCLRDIIANGGKPLANCSTLK